MGIYKTWGTNIDVETHQQMENACSLPVSVGGALMPDAHVGYGIPIGGVLATQNAVIPYAVGVDIACRVMLSVVDLPVQDLWRRREKLEKILNGNTCFGVGAEWPEPFDHAVMHKDWNVTGVTKALKDKAWRQLGTSGSGNHFVEFGQLDIFDSLLRLPTGKYFAIVSHSGSRGAGAQVAEYYSKLAQSQHLELPRELNHLAWLDMNQEGAEYWAAMELMGQYASANHHIIHSNLLAALSGQLLTQVENHHNFAWKEKFNGQEYIIHRKGATPAGKGVLGYIPGTMVDPGYLVEGLGEVSAYNSCAHGAGRQMSRRKAKKTMTYDRLSEILKEKGVHLISAGLDESPHAYKDINQVMQAQSDLVRIIAKFSPLIVKMAPAGEWAED